MQQNVEYYGKSELNLTRRSQSLYIVLCFLPSVLPCSSVSCLALPQNIPLGRYNAVAVLRSPSTRWATLLGLQKSKFVWLCRMPHAALNLYLAPQQQLHYE